MTTTAVDKDMINIWFFTSSDIDPTNCIKTGTPTGSQVLPWKAEITNFGRTGGAQQSEQKVCFGGNQTIDKPRDPFEISIDVSPTVETLDRWNKLFLVADAVNSTVYTSRQLPADVTVFLEIYDSATTTYHSYGWNNVNIGSSDDTFSSEDGMSLSLSLMIPTKTGDVANYMYSKCAVTALPDWTELDGN